MSTALSSAAPPVVPPQHDARGRFVKGNRGGPGNPLAGKVNKVRKAFLDYFEGPAMGVLCDYMMRKALSGDPRFLRLILQYTIGKLPAGDGFVDDEADVAQAEAEALTELEGEMAAAADDQPAEDQPAEDQPAAGATSSVPAASQRQEVESAGRDAGMALEVGGQPAWDSEPAGHVATGVTEVPNPPRSRSRERLLRLLEDGDPVRGDLWAISPSTNGLGEAKNIPLVGNPRTG
jgi:hypothetical protein